MDLRSSEPHTGTVKPEDGARPQHRGAALAEHLGRYVEQIADYAIIALDPRGVIETWNLGAQRLKGYTAAEAIGRNFDMLYTREDRRAGLPTSLLLEATRNGRVEHIGWRIGKGGHEFWGDVVITAVHDDEGRHIGFIKVTRDRSELKRLEAARDTFYSTFSHDFKTPIAAMLGCIEALRSGPDEASARLIDRAEANAQRLFEMVDELVTIARERAELSSLLTYEVDVAAVARSALDHLPSSLAAGRVDLQASTALARANGPAMHRVISNLLDNALKYSPPDSSVRMNVSETPTGDVEITIADNGRGIDPGDLDTIFDAFQRGRLATADGGTGLGLSSVRELLIQQNGNVHIDSQLGVGTTVAVTIPGLADPISARDGAPDADA